jgi:type II secretory pathway pseudopilin PulG
MRKLRVKSRESRVGLGGARSSRLSTLDSRPSSGFTLVGVVVAIAILTILVAAIGPSISAVMQRDREAELIFRGRQYARAIVLFQRRFGRLPGSLKELAESRPHTVRRLWKEPMCNCDDWHLIIAGTPDAVPPGSGPAAGAGRAPGSGDQPPSTYTGLFSRTPPPSSGGVSPTAGFPSLFGTPSTQTVGPIIGVRSNVHKRGFRKWRDLEYYDEWRFIAGDADRELGHYVDPNLLRGIRFTPGPTP